LAPKLERGFHLARETVHPQRCLVVYGGTKRFPMAEETGAMSLIESCEVVASS
jgi:hypothetical protein